MACPFCPVQVRASVAFDLTTAENYTQEREVHLDFVVIPDMWRWSSNSGVWERELAHARVQRTLREAFCHRPFSAPFGGRVDCRKGTQQNHASRLRSCICVVQNRRGCSSSSYFSGLSSNGSVESRSPARQSVSSDLDNTSCCALRYLSVSISRAISPGYVLSCSTGPSASPLGPVGARGGESCSPTELLMRDVQSRARRGPEDAQQVVRRIGEDTRFFLYQPRCAGGESRCVRSTSGDSARTPAQFVS